MGNQPMRPKPPHAAALRARVDESCETAAEAILGADVLLLATGAGWSADSGLAVYRDIARIEAYAERDLDYRDMRCGNQPASSLARSNRRRFG